MHSTKRLKYKDKGKVPALLDSPADLGARSLQLDPDNKTQW